MKKLLAVALILCLLVPCALADGNYNPLNQEGFETIFHTAQKYYVVPDLPDADNRESSASYAMNDYVVQLRFGQDEMIDFSVLTGRELNFEMISMMACVWVSVFGDENWDLIMGLVYDYIHNGVSIRLFNNESSAAILQRKDSGLIDFAIMLSYTK